MIIKALAASLVAALFAAPALAATPIHVYQLAPVVERGKVIALSVTLTLPADADGETRLRVPSSAARRKAALALHQGSGGYGRYAFGDG